jgi:hypothetical protein
MVLKQLNPRNIAVVVALAVVLSTAPAAHAVLGESDIPETTIVPSEGGTPAPAVKPPAPPALKPAPAPRKKTATQHPAPETAREASKLEVEPAEARVKLIADTPVFTEPSKNSRQIEKAHAGKFIQVTGSTRYFLRVSLKSGQTGYIDPSAVELVRPTDKIFALTSDAAVLEKPNRWAKKLSEVHKGHDVHVIGIALNYTKIRMKSGLEGFIPISALE